jgi:hypothetical protein
MSSVVSSNLARTAVYIRSTGELLGRSIAAIRPIVALLAPANSPVEGVNASLTVTLDKVWDEDIVMDWVAANGTAIAGTDYGTLSNATPPSGTVTIPAGDLSASFTIATIDRAEYQAARSFTVTVSNARTDPSADPITIEADDDETVIILDSDQPSGDHGYFEALIERPDYWKGMSFRPIAGRPQTYASGAHTGKLDPYYGNQLLKPSSGGYANSNTNPLRVTYEPGSDTDAHAQDAAKIRIPSFQEFSNITLQADLVIGETVVVLGTGFSVGNGSSYKVGNEIITITNGKTTAEVSTTCARGQFGTTEATHLAGTTLYRSGNSLGNQVRFPLATVAGTAYLFTWDTYYTDSYCRNAGIGELQSNWLKNHKAFQFSRSPVSGSDIWMEPATRFSPSGNAPSPAAGFNNTIHVCEADWRSYMNLSTDVVFDPLNPQKHPSSVTRKYPMRPMEAAFIIHPNRWTRWWVHFDSIVDDYDRLNVWIADEVQAPVKLFDDFPIKAYQTGVPNGSIGSWWVELNTSDTEHLRLDQRDFVAYIRNFCALTLEVADVDALLVQP